MDRYTGIRVYAAGKIEKNGWRERLFSIRGAFETYYANPGEYPWPAELPIAGLPGAVYTGPHFMSDDHGCYHAEPNSHGVAAGSSACGGAYPGLTRPDVTKRCLSAIEESTHVFAWIDDPTAYGSLVEIGYARALGKQVYLYFRADADLDDLWFSTQIASSYAEVSDVLTAWEDFSVRLNHGGLV